MAPNPDRTYILARPWLDYREGTVTKGFPDLDDDQLAQFLDSIGAWWIRKYLGSFEAKPSADDPDKFIRVLQEWAQPIPDPDKALLRTLEPDFAQNVGNQIIAHAALKSELPKCPKWIVMHAMDTPQHAHAVIKCLVKEGPGRFDVELTMATQRQLDLTVWAALEVGLRDFDSLQRDWEASIASEHLLNPVKQLRKRVLDWAKIIDDGFVPAGDTDLEDDEPEVETTAPLPVRLDPQSVEPPAAVATSAHPRPVFCAPSEHAAQLKIGHETLRKRLERARTSGEIPDGDWIEVQDRKPRQAQFLYSEAAVKALLVKMKPSSEVSSERPAKRNPKN